LYLAEKHIISKTHSLYEECDRLCFLAKNLHNRANYIVRQEFISTSKAKKIDNTLKINYLNYNKINRIMIDDHDVDYYALPTKVSNQVLMQLDTNWTSFFKSIKDWRINPSK